MEELEGFEILLIGKEFRNSLEAKGFIIFTEEEEMDVGFELEGFFMLDEN